MALDHPWVEDHPEYFVAGTEAELEREPQNYIRVKRKEGKMVLAYGRDPYFSGWPDTLQLDYSNPAAQEAMIGELQKIASQCDGVRCDMAMLALNDVIEKVWGDLHWAKGVTRPATEFWREAIRTVKEQYPDFIFIAETYWDLEAKLQELGFDGATGPLIR
jgi:glycosidase